MTIEPPVEKPVGPPDPTDLWQAWQSDPSPQNFSATLKALQPVINVALVNRNSVTDPIMRAHARAIAGEAIKSYQPTAGAGLPTWTTQQMQRLARIRRNTGNAVRLPERVQLDHMDIQRATQEFMDEQDREPSIAELAERTRLSRRRVSAVLRMSRQTPTEAAIGENNLLLGQNNVEMDEALDMVYEDSDPTDQKILEWRAGYGGAEVIPAQEAAKRLKMSPFAISRRVRRLALKIQKMERDLSASIGKQNT